MNAQCSNLILFRLPLEEKFEGAHNQISVKYISTIQVGTRRKFGGAYKNERGKTFIVVS